MPPLRCANGPSTARCFVHLASRSYTTSTTAATHASQAHALEFLAPRCTSLRPLPLPSASRTHMSRLSLSSSSQLPHESMRHPNKRAFSTTSHRQATVCIQNPVKDDDGKEMLLEITSRAAKRLSKIMVKDENPNLALRIQVESGGCHGFQYLMSLVTIPPEGSSERSSVINEDDSVFQYVAEDGEALDSPQAPRIILDEPSLELLTGSKVDFTMELIGSQFKITDNPHATSSCGCGTSFDVKI